MSKSSSKKLNTLPPLPTKKSLIVNSWIEEFADGLAHETFKLIVQCPKPEGSEISYRVMASYLRHYTRRVIYDVLTIPAEGVQDNQEAYKITYKAYSELKRELESNIARGFEEAFHIFTGRFVDYNCSVDVVPDPINKEPC